MDKLPDLERLIKFVHRILLYDSYVKKSIEDGFITEQELLIGKYISAYCDLHTPEKVGEETRLNYHDKWEDLWQSNLPRAYLAAAKQFDVTPERAEELFKKTLDSRARNVKN